jgi:hypothetical protein
MDLIEVTLVVIVVCKCLVSVDGQIYFGVLMDRSSLFTARSVRE